MRKEIHTGTMPTGRLPDISMSADGDLDEREPDLIMPADRVVDGDYFEQLAFMEQPVTIRIEPLAEKYAARFVDVYVNGRMQLIEVGRPQAVKRKYVETLARAMPVDIQTHVDQPEGQDPVNKVVRFRRCKYPFSVIHDPDTRGADWLTNLLQAAA